MGAWRGRVFGERFNYVQISDESCWTSRAGYFSVTFCLYDSISNQLSFNFEALEYGRVGRGLLMRFYSSHNTFIMTEVTHALSQYYTSIKLLLYYMYMVPVLEVSGHLKYN